MAVQFNPYAGLSQSAVTNPFVQRGEDQTRANADRSEDRDRTQVRAQNASAAESQQAETRNRERVTAREDNEDRPRQTRGSNVDITV